MKCFTICTNTKRFIFTEMIFIIIFEVFDTVISGALKGAGDTAFVMWWMLVGAFVLWLPLVAAVAHFRNTMPMLWATIVFEVAALSVGTILRWRKGGWKNIRI